MSKTVKIIRSRFQPFTKYHLELIEEIISMGDEVALCIIRDYETVIRWYKPAILGDVEQDDLRHMRIFNPLTSWEVCNQIQKCLLKSNIKSGSPLPVIISPLKFTELVEIAYNNGEIVIKGIERFINKHKCSESDFKNCSIKSDILKIYSVIAFDHMPKAFNYEWVFGMFDHEDEKDYTAASRCGVLVSTLKPKTKIPKMDLPGNNTIQIGLYGQFMLHIYLNFILGIKHNTDNKFKNVSLTIPEEFSEQKEIQTKINSLETIIKSYMIDDEEFEFFKKKAGVVCIELLDKLPEIPESEKKLLTNYHSFAKLANTTIGA